MHKWRTRKETHRRKTPRDQRGLDRELHVHAGVDVNEDLLRVTLGDGVDGRLDGQEVAGAVAVDGDYPLPYRADPVVAPARGVVAAGAAQVRGRGQKEEAEEEERWQVAHWVAGGSRVATMGRGHGRVPPLRIQRSTVSAASGDTQIFKGGERTRWMLTAAQ